MSVDVCSTTSVSSSHGYLRSPDYPDSEHSARRRCGCRLRASSRIIVSVLDLSTATADDDHGAESRCPSSTADVVRVASADGAVARRYCGRLESDRLPEAFDTRRGDAVVQFLSHGWRRRARGFWLAYTSSSSSIFTTRRSVLAMALCPSVRMLQVDVPLKQLNCFSRFLAYRLPST